MDENNINITEEAKEPVYTSNYFLSRDFYYDFCLVGYNKLKKMLFAFLCATAFLIVISILNRNYEIVVSSLIISFLMFVMYFKTTRAAKINYERHMIAAGKVSFYKEDFFEDKIVSGADGLKREYYYNQITKFFETKNFLLLHLQHNLFMAINKNTLNADVNEVKAFLMQKCPFVKKKKFIDCSNDKKWSLTFLIALISISVLSTIISFILIFVSLF